MCISEIYLDITKFNSVQAVVHWSCKDYHVKYQNKNFQRFHQPYNYLLLALEHVTTHDIYYIFVFFFFLKKNIK